LNHLMRMEDPWTPAKEIRMELVPWNEALSVKIGAIDEQHKKLISIINELYAAMVERKGQRVLSDLVERMRNYAVTHFGTEERYMIEFKYLGYQAHKEEHEKFIAKVKDLEARLNNHSFVLSLEVASFLKDWLSAHILGTDKKYGPHFNRHGLH